jgi:hypothetical protein
MEELGPLYRLVSTRMTSSRAGDRCICHAAGLDQALQLLGKGPWQTYTSNYNGVELGLAHSNNRDSLNPRAELGERDHNDVSEPTNRYWPIGKRDGHTGWIDNLRIGHFSLLRLTNRFRRSLSAFVKAWRLS